MKVGYLITARLKSTRLPLKLFKQVEGKPILTHMLDRLRLARSVDKIVICTSFLPEDDPLAEFAERNGVECFRGDPEDVIARLSEAAAHFKFDYVLNITADCPFADPAYADRIVECYNESGPDLIRVFDLPHGVFSYGIRPQALKNILRIKDSTRTEVWGRYFTDTDLFRVHDLVVEPRHHRPELRMTLDYPEDLEFLRTIFAELYSEGQVFSLDQILELLNRRPEIIAINRDCAKRFRKRFVAQSSISLKERHEVKRAGIVGCGSIGQRHIRNLRHLGIDDIVALRSRKGHYQELPSELRVTETTDPDEFARSAPDVIFVTNPSSLHMQTCLSVPGSCRSLFIEKPLAHDLSTVQRLLGFLRDRKMGSFVGFNLQFHPAIQAVRNYLLEKDLGDPLTMQCEVGHWLPDWHPYEDYASAYFARNDLGGGAALTLIHEVHLAVDILGPGKTVCAVFQGSDKLQLDVESRADFMVTHQGGGVSQIHLDFLQRPLTRRGLLCCTQGWVSWDLVANIVQGQVAGEPAQTTVWHKPDYDPNGQYLEEMKLFLRYVKEGRVRHEFDAWRGTLSLAIVDSARQAAETSCARQVPDMANVAGRWV